MVARGACRSGGIGRRKMLWIVAWSMQLRCCQLTRGDHQVFDVIDFLESMGQDAQLRHASQDEMGRALASAEIDPELRVAILAKDEQELQALLGQVPFCCLINPAKPGEEQEECDGNCKEGEEKKDDKDKEKDKRRDGD